MGKSFKQLTEFTGDSRVVLVIDALNLAFRYKPRAKAGQPIPEQEAFMEDYIGVVESLAKSYNAGKIIIAQDGGYSWRLGVYPSYKEARRLKNENATPEEQKAFNDFLDAFNETIDAIRARRPWLILKYQGVEADDIAAYITNRSKEWKYSVWLASSDKDWNLLIDDNVSQFSYVTRKVYTKENWEDHYDFSIDDYISIKCLNGDTGDSVPGIPQVGPTRALALVQKYGTAWDLYESLPIDVSMYS